MTCSILDLESRFGSLPDLLAQTESKAAPDLLDIPFAVHQWDVVGVGASEAPARLLVSCLNDLRIAARFCSISFFAKQPDSPESLRSRGLIVFSQGLSPNARLALDHAAGYRGSVLFTSVDASEDSERGETLRQFPGVVWPHSPSSEPGSLLRLVGPPIAAMSALRLALLLARGRGSHVYWDALLGRVAECYRGYAQAEDQDAVARLVQGERPAGCLAIGADTEIAGPLMWKWQEGLYQPLAPSFDVLAFAHGPLQSIYKRDCLLVALVRSERSVSPEGRHTAHSHAALWARLEEVISKSGQGLVRLVAKLPGPLAFFEWDAAWSRLLLSSIAEQSINPGTWPGKNADTALYALGAESD